MPPVGDQNAPVELEEKKPTPRRFLSGVGVVKGKSDGLWFSALGAPFFASALLGGSIFSSSQTSVE